MCGRHKLHQLIREARVNNRDLTMVWLDLANAYGSIPHNQHYHVPGHIKGINTEYLDGVHLLFSVRDKMAQRQRLEKGGMQT